jgi:hypothetical protein
MVMRFPVRRGSAGYFPTAKYFQYCRSFIQSVSSGTGPGAGRAASRQSASGLEPKFGLGSTCGRAGAARTPDGDQAVAVERDDDLGRQEEVQAAGPTAPRVLGQAHGDRLTVRALLAK